MFCRQAPFERTDGDIIIIPFYLVIRFPVPVRVGLQRLSFPYGQGQEGVEGPRDSSAGDETGTKSLRQLFKGIDGIRLEGIEPSHRHGSQARWEYPTH